MNIYIYEKTTTKNALAKINKFGGKSLIVIKKNKVLSGVLTSGDLRKAIINKKISNKNIKFIYNKKAKYIFKDDVNLKKIKNIFKTNKIDILPVVEKKSLKVVKYYDLNSLINKKHKKRKKINANVVIMAGGRGVRMRPVTEILPKPLIPINKKPIIQHIVERFNKFGVNKFYVTINHKSQFIKAYFKEAKLKSKFNFITEKKPKGTIGGVRILINKIHKNFFLTNCDTLVNADYNQILKKHTSEKNMITIVAVKKDYKIPYGSCVLKKNGTLKEILEKPIFKLNINVGFYVLNYKVLKLIPSNGSFDITDLIKTILSKGGKIGLFKIKKSSWKDIGQWTEYKKVMNTIFNQ